MTFPSVVVQSFLTFTAKRWAQSPTITFTNGATAGSEVVSVDSSNNILVQIQSGTTTMLQVKTAIQNHVVSSGFSANDLVTVSVTTGHNSDTVKTLVNATFSGGVTSAVAATLTVGPLKLIAVTAGTGGNSIRLKFTGGATAGSEVVTVSTNDITVQIADGVSSYGQILTALAASGAAAALVTASGLRALFASPSYTALDSPAPLSQNAAFVSDLSVFTNLAGGLAAAPASVVVQGITITSNTNDATQNGATFTCTEGATAGSEVVTVVGNNVSVQIQNGVSTVTQVRTALQAAGAFTTLYTATGTSSTAVVTVNAEAMSGAVGPSTAGSLGFYTDQGLTTLTTAYQYIAFGNIMGDTTFANDDASGTNKLSISWDGMNVHGIIPAAQSLSFDRANKSGVYVKYVTGSPTFRIIAVAQ